MVLPIRPTRITFGQSKKLIKIFLVLLLLLLSSTGSVGAASTATSVVETQIEGEGDVQTSIETTVNGQTVKKESNTPGKLELKMEQSGENEPTISFSQTLTSTPTSPTPTPPLVPAETKPFPESIAASVIDFVKNFLSDLSKELMLRFTQH